MSVLFTDTMTVYNYFKDTKTEKEFWNRTVVKGVQWSHNKTEISTLKGIQTEKKVESITIDFQKRYGNKQYLPPNEYRNLPIEEVSNYWTLDTKNVQDILVFGVSEKEINDDYRLSELRNDFQYVVTVLSVSDNRNRPRLKHIKVIGE